MKIFRLFTIAAAALILSACSEDIAQMINGGKKEFTATLAAPNKGGTRTVYTEDTQNNKIAVAWKVGDEIALVHNGVKDVVKVKTVNADGSATIDGTITSATDEATVQLVYPAARISGVTSDGNPVFDGSVEGKISSQDGTLTYIQNNIDFREGEGQLSVNGTEVTLNAAVDMVSSIAIWKLTLQNDAETPAALSAKQVSVQLTADVPILRARTAELTTPISSFYLAMEPFLEAPITIEATVDEDTYSYVKEGVTLEAGKYYQSTVTMANAWDGNLATVTKNVTATDGTTIYGTLGKNVMISIADGATVTLDGVDINATGTWTTGNYAGITCLGDATIILKDGTENTVKGFYQEYPGIHPAVGHTLIIKGGTAGTGSLDASSNGRGAGIGGGGRIACGNIEIQGGKVTAQGGSSAAGIGGGASGGGSCGTITISGGTVTATGGGWAAGIGSGNSGSCVAIEISGGTVEATGGNKAAGIGSGASGSCGNIKIEGGTVTATGGDYAAGIGGGQNNKTCGTITITSGVTSVTATKGADAPNSIGKGSGESAQDITVNIDAGANVTATGHALSASAVGEIVGSDGKAYAVADKNYMPSGVTAVAMVAYKSATVNESLAIQLNGSPEKMRWADANTYPAGLTAVSGGRWCLPSKKDWQDMFVGCAVSGDASASDNMDPIAGFKAKIAATGITWKSGSYWSSTESGSKAWFVYVELGYANASFTAYDASNSFNVLGCLAF